MSRILGFIRAAAAVVLSTACASDQPPDANQTSDQHVSTIPWNRPESWEGQGPMSNMMPGNSR